MKKEMLTAKIAELVGVSSSEADFASKLFMDHISHTLDFDEALRIPNLGIFQLKKDLDSKDKSIVIYSPSTELSVPDQSALFMSFKVDSKDKVAGSDFSEEIFSLGIGKPVVPLKSNINNKEDVNASYFMLKKSIEERIKELIANSIKLENYDLWEEYINQNEVEAPEEIEKAFQSDEDFLQQMIDEDDFDLPPITPKKVETSGFEALERDLEAFRQMAERELSEDDEIEHKSEPEDEIIDEPEDVIIPDTKNDLAIEEEKFDKLNIPDDDEEFLPGEDENNLEPENLEEKDPFELLQSIENFEDVDEEDESEFILDIEKENESDENGFPDLVGEIENSDDDDENESDEEPPRIIGTTIGTLDETTRLASTKNGNQTNISKGNKMEDDKNEVEEEKVDTKFWLSVGGLGLIIIIVAFYFLFIDGDSPKTELPSNDTETVDQMPQEQNGNPGDNNEVIQNDSKQPVTEAKNPQQVETVKNEVPKPKEKETSSEVQKPAVSSELYRTISGDKVAQGTIYTDGKYYTIQIGASRNKAVTEREVKRYRSQGHNAFILQVNIPSKGGTWYRMRIGDFNTLQEAKNYKQKYKL